MIHPDPPDTLDDPKTYLTDDQSVWLGNGETRHDFAPKTFWIPSRNDRMNLVRGDCVKVLFCCNPAHYGGMDAERMWCIVTARREDGRYEAVIDNTPHQLPLHLGQSVVVGPENVIDISPNRVPEAAIPRSS